MSADPAAAAFFQSFPVQAATAAGLDATLGARGDALTILFLWGNDCPNCDVAKRALSADPARFIWDDVQWLHCNVYDDPDMATRFSLHGVPTFFVFRGTTKLGRITSWPGGAAFAEAIEKQRC
ncbi:thioredoxin family protein [Roseiterribacter gracilis]|uniref:Thiol reductase thioredoxin n=1 Tax=Roseiterribacter gracilis TaxID=2812848 RepID=A0A8S8XFE7_9PROT|nr:thiol reductase thioredoxin [Rhodospirillales bacterium TMPK1]